MVRYAQASKGRESYGIESSAYQKATDTSNYFGLVRDEIDYPNPNPHTGMTTGGQGRGPYVNSPDPIEREFDIAATVLDESTPIELALGQRTETVVDPDGVASSGDEYTKAVFTEADVLPTATIEHVQEDINLAEWFIGCKASLTISAANGEPLTTEFGFTATDHDYSETISDAATVAVPDLDPYRFNMIGEITLTDSNDGTTVKTLATPNSIDFSWDNGNEVRHHGQGREGYAVAETTAEDKYDMSMNVDIEDLDLYKRAADNDSPVDVEVVFDRDYGWSDPMDAVFIRLNHCKVVNAPVPNASEGVVEADIELLPTETEIEIRTPN